MSSLLEFEEFVKERASNISTPLWDYLLYVNEDYEDYQEDMLGEVRNLFGASGFAYGCSKVVLFFQEFPEFVLKIPLMGSCYAKWDYNEEEYCIYDKYCYTGASNGGMYSVVDEDYCEAEAYVYDLARINGVSKFFAGTHYLGMFNDIKCYAAERVEEDELFSDSYHSHVSDRSRKLAIESNFTFREAIAQLYEVYEEDEVNEFLAFVREYDIDDLHTGNWGWIDGRLKVIDYCSFND